MAADRWRDIDFRKHPEPDEIGRGEQGVLIAEPYKSEILPHWRFATPDKAKASADKILSMFYEYKEQSDFVGMGMARKFLQMGYTRARRYANHKGSKKYDGPVPDDKKGQRGAHGREDLPRSPEDPGEGRIGPYFLRALCNCPGRCGIQSDGGRTPGTSKKQVQRINIMC